MTNTNKIIAISDLHLGQSGADKFGQYSLLSTRSAKNLVHVFADAAARFAGGDPVTLLIAGDGVDLSLSYMADALADLQALIAELKSRVQLAEIVYVIGNHDHHLWSLHSENARVLGPLRAGQLPQDGAVYRVTSESGEAFTLLQPLVDAIAAPLGTEVTIAYPSYARELSDGKLLYVTHGHLFGGLYTELSDLLQDKLGLIRHDRAVATVNQPVIELVYWLLGETGEGMGADGLTEAIYTDLQKGKDARVKALVERLVAQLLPNGVLWRALGGVERRIIVDAVMAELDKAVLSPRLGSVTAADRFADVEVTRAGLKAWMDARDMSIRQIFNGAIVLYGHTHVRDEYVIHGTNVHSYNLGTWLVEPNHDAPKTGFLAIDGGAARWIDVGVA